MMRKPAPRSQRRYVSRLVPESSTAFLGLIIFASISTALTSGYDAAMIGGLNTLPQYYEYFNLSTMNLGLSTSSIYIGACIASPIANEVCDRFGRKPGMLWGSVVTLIGVVLQGSAQNMAMFIMGRVLIGAGSGVSGTAAPVYIAEAAPVKWRGFSLGIMNDFWHVGSLISAGITYGTFVIAGTWSWRIPSLLQALPSIGCIVVLPFIPESPRYLTNKGRLDDAKEVLAVCHADGHEDDPVVKTEYDQISAALETEKQLGKKTTWLETVKGKGNRKRMLLVLGVAIIVQCSGNNFLYYYLGPVLHKAGVKDSRSILGFYIGLEAFALMVCLLSTVLVDRQGRRSLALWSTGILTVSIFLIAIFIRIDETHGNRGTSIGTILFLFTFIGGYSWGWTPLAIIYPPEILSYSIRASGLAIFTFVQCAMSLFTTFVFPYFWVGIDWKIYIVNGIWDILEFAFIYFLFVETKRKTLEEIDELFDGSQSPTVPLSRVTDVELVHVPLTKES